MEGSFVRIEESFRSAMNTISNVAAQCQVKVRLHNVVSAATLEL